MEASRHLRPHEKNAITTSADQAKRISPLVHEYAQKLGELGMEYVDPYEPEKGCRMIDQPPVTSAILTEPLISEQHMGD